MNRPRSHEERLSDLLDAYLQCRERGETPDPGTFCASDPDLREEFLELVDDAEQLDFLVDDLRLERSGLPADPLVGQLVGGKFRIERLIGRGGMGAVYAARHEGLDRPVAVKLLGELRVGRPEAHERFQRESLALGRLRHPDIVAVSDQGESDGRPYLVMERIDGIDLHEWLRCAHQGRERGAFRPRSSALRHLVQRAGEPPGPVPDRAVERFWRRPYHELVAAVAARVARALHAAHAAGVLHRDVKPSNILLTPQGRVLLTDFGLARLEGEPSLTRADDSLGTPCYMAPEQLRRGSEGVDGRADVYGLGAALYHLLTFRAPFEGSSVSVLARLRTELPPEPRRLRPEIPRDLEAICLQAMEKHPGDRYTTAAALAEDLEAFVERRAVRARRPGSAGRLTRWVRRRPLRAAIYGLSAILLAVLAVAFHFQQLDADRLRSQELAELRAQLPALLTLEAHPGRRLLRPHRDPEVVGRDLDRILELDPGDVIARFYRASFRSQHGDVGGAREDLVHLENAGFGSELLSQLSAIATHPDDGQRWLLPAPEELPAAATEFDHFLRAYVALRWQKYPFARSELDAAIAAGGALATLRDLRAIAALGELDYAAALNDAYAVEGLLGCSTARTQHVIGAALYLYGDDKGAEKCLRRSIELRPEGHGPHHNLGLVLERQERLQEALAMLRRAIELRPEVWNTRAHLARLLRDTGNYEAAIAELETALENPAYGARAAVRLSLGTLYLQWWRDLRKHRGETEGEAQREAARQIFLELANPDARWTRPEFKAAVNLVFLRAEAGELGGEEALGEVLSLLNKHLAGLTGLPRSYWPFLEDPVLLASVGYLCDRLGRTAEAEAFLRLALKSETCPNIARIDLAEVLVESGQIGAAVAIALRDAGRLRKLPRFDALIEKIRGELSHAERASFAEELEKRGVIVDEESTPDPGPAGAADR